MTTDPKALEEATAIMLAETGTEGGCPQVDWYRLRNSIAAALAQPRPEQVEDGAVRHRVAMICMEISEDRDAENVADMFRVYEHAEHWTLTKCPAGCGRCDVDRAYSHADRMIAALAHLAPKPAGVAEARRAADAAGYYGSLAACIEDLSRRVRAAEALAASPAPANAAPASVVSHEPPERETQQGLRVTHETQACASESEGA